MSADELRVIEEWRLHRDGELPRGLARPWPGGHQTRLAGDDQRCAWILHAAPDHSVAIVALGGLDELLARHHNWEAAPWAHPPVVIKIYARRWTFSPAWGQRLVGVARCLAEVVLLGHDGERVLILRGDGDEFRRSVSARLSELRAVVDLDVPEGSPPRRLPELGPPAEVVPGIRETSPAAVKQQHQRILEGPVTPGDEAEAERVIALAFDDIVRRALVVATGSRRRVVGYVRPILEVLYGIGELLRGNAEALYRRLREVDPERISMTRRNFVFALGLIIDTGTCLAERPGREDWILHGAGIRDALHPIHVALCKQTRSSSGRSPSPTPASSRPSATTTARGDQLELWPIASVDPPAAPASEPPADQASKGSGTAALEALLDDLDPRVDLDPHEQALAELVGGLGELCERALAGEDLELAQGSPAAGAAEPVAGAAGDPRFDEGDDAAGPGDPTPREGGERPPRPPAPVRPECWFVPEVAAGGPGVQAQLSVPPRSILIGGASSTETRGALDQERQEGGVRAAEPAERGIEALAEDVPAAGPGDPRHLGDLAGRVVDEAAGGRRERGIEARVCEGELGGAEPKIDAHASDAPPPLGGLEHRRRSIEHDHRGPSSGGQGRIGAGADVEDVIAGPAGDEADAPGDVEGRDIPPARAPAEVRLVRSRRSPDEGDTRDPD